MYQMQIHECFLIIQCEMISKLLSILFLRFLDVGLQDNALEILILSIWLSSVISDQGLCANLLKLFNLFVILDPIVSPECYSSQMQFSLQWKGF